MPFFARSMFGSPIQAGDLGERISTLLRAAGYVLTEKSGKYVRVERADGGYERDKLELSARVAMTLVNRETYNTLDPRFAEAVRVSMSFVDWITGGDHEH